MVANLNFLRYNVDQLRAMMWVAREDTGRFFPGR